MPKAKAKPRGRPQLEIDWRLVDNLAAVFCTHREIIDALGVSYKTMHRATRREKKTTFAEYVESKRDLGRRKLRLVQMHHALNGNVTMMIWLGKNLLGQQDKREVVDKKWAERTPKERLIELGRQAIDTLERPEPTTPAAEGREATLQ